MIKQGYITKADLTPLNGIITKKSPMPELWASSDIPGVDGERDPVSGAQAVINLNEVVSETLPLLDSGGDMRRFTQRSRSDHPTSLHHCNQGVHGDAVNYATTKEQVVLIPGLNRPIMSEVRLCTKTSWRKVCLSENECAMIQLSKYGEKLLKSLARTHALKRHHLVIEEGQRRRSVC